MQRLTWISCALILLSGCELYFGPDPDPETRIDQPADVPPTDPNATNPSPGCSDEFCEPSACVQDDECPSTEYCEELTGRCLPADSCQSSEQCAEGYACSDRRLCVPSPCRSHSDCMEGCYCDIGAGYCIEGGFCATSADCSSGFSCETNRETCEPEREPPHNEECED